MILAWKVQALFRLAPASGMVLLGVTALELCFMGLSRALVLLSLLLAAPAWAQQSLPSAAVAAASDQPPTAVAAASDQPMVPSDRPMVEEDHPDFQPLRPAPPLEPVANSAPAPITMPLPPPVVAPAVPPPPVVAAPAPPPPAAVLAAPVALPAPGFVLPGWALALLVVAGALLAALFGVMAARSLRGTELAERRRAVAASLATEMETRRLAFESVPLPPNVEAGVSFVSAVISMAGIDCAFRLSQGTLFLLPPQLVANISVHYAAVQRVADFVKGQSMAAAVRMLQANRLGGHPCPDAGAMREAHVELAAAFRGLDKVILNLRAISR